MAHRKALLAASLVAVAGLAVLTPSTVAASPRGYGHGHVHGGVAVGFYAPLYYSPFYSPFGWGFGYGWGAPYGAYGPYAPYAVGPYGYAHPYDISGSARIQVTPKEAAVYVDGYRAGRVDDFDGTFQRLNVAPGPRAHAVPARLSHRHRARLLRRRLDVEAEAVAREARPRRDEHAPARSAQAGAAPPARPS